MWVLVHVSKWKSFLSWLQWRHVCTRLDRPSDQLWHSVQEAWGRRDRRVWLRRTIHDLWHCPIWECQMVVLPQVGHLLLLQNAIGISHSGLCCMIYISLTDAYIHTCTYIRTSTLQNEGYSSCTGMEVSAAESLIVCLWLQWVWLWIHVEDSDQHKPASRRAGILWAAAHLLPQHLRCQIPDEKLSQPEGWLAGSCWPIRGEKLCNHLGFLKMFKSNMSMDFLFIKNKYIHFSIVICLVQYHVKVQPWNLFWNASKFYCFSMKIFHSVQLDSWWLG